MRILSVICFGLLAVASASPMVDIDDTKIEVFGLKDKQKVILKLLNNVMDHVMYKDIEEIGREYVIEENMDKYIKTDVVKDFIKLVKVGVLPRGEIFTMHIEKQLDEVVKMFHILYYAKDFTTFLKTACWMRLNMNEGMFVYALTIACRHRDDCRGIVLPPPYEIYPYYFVRADVIQKAYLLKMKKGLLDKKLCDFYGIKKTDKDVYIIDENIFDTRVNLNEEDKLRYFTEDIGLNTYYYYFHVDYPFWMKDDVMMKTNIRRFEMTLYIYQQILARYYLERLSNGLGDITPLTWDKPIRKGYWPWMKLHNGVELRIRKNDKIILKDDKIEVLRLVETYEQIIKEAILVGYIDIDGMRLELTKVEDVETLGKMIYGKIDRKDVDKKRIEAYRYLLILMKAVLGLNTMKCDKYFVVPSVLDQYQTALRDPVFYQLQKRLIDFVILFKKRLPSYKQEDLYFPGVKIDNIVVDKLVTYFDEYLMDITNAVTMTDEEIKKTVPDMIFMVRKLRLNHQPFKVVVDVMSDKTVDSLVKIFLGPKVDKYNKVIDINKNRLNFVEIDSFVHKLESGRNTIVRKSVDMHNLIKDRMMMRDVMKKLDSTTDITDILKKDLLNYNTGFPLRLLLPKGRTGGMNMMLYVIVSPMKLVDNIDRTKMDILDKKVMCHDCRFLSVLDKMPLGFPFDREIDETTFFTSNMKFVDVVIFHKNLACDMKTRWENYILKGYKMTDKVMGVDTMMIDNTYNMDFDNLNIMKDNKRIIDDTL